MSEDIKILIVLSIAFAVFSFGVEGGIVFANWQHGYVSDDTVVKFRMAENVTTNMTNKEKIELIKTVCEDNVQRDVCYGKMYDIYIEPSIGR